MKTYRFRFKFARTSTKQVNRLTNQRRARFEGVSDLNIFQVGEPRQQLLKQWSELVDQRPFDWSVESKEQFLNSDAMIPNEIQYPLYVLHTK